MNWKQPTNVWQWMSLCAPAISGLLALWAADVLMAPVPRLHLANGADVVNIGAILYRALFVSTSAMTAVSVPLAFFLTRNQSWLARIGNTVGLTFLLVFFNSFIALAGCAAVSEVGSIISR